jgi:tetratricopeptide (TPR) repeat protein
VDQQTKAALKQDQFVTTTAQGLQWASANRKSVITTAGILLGVIVLVVIGAIVWNSRTAAAANAFGDAMAIYTTPIALKNQPAPPGTKTYPTIADRARAANPLFKQVADQYGMTKDGTNALYFEGLTFMEMGQTQSAEDTLKKVSGSFDKQVAALAKFALADLYRQTGRDPQAIEFYNELTAKPTDTVPAGLAQIQLAELYSGEGKADQAKKIYAQLKDKDAKGAAGTIAAEKLNPAPAGRAGL